VKFGRSDRLQNLEIRWIRWITTRDRQKNDFKFRIRCPPNFLSPPVCWRLGWTNRVGKWVRRRQKETDNSTLLGCITYELCIDRHHTNYASIATIRIMQQLHYLLRFPFWWSVIVNLTSWRLFGRPGRVVFVNSWARLPAPSRQASTAACQTPRPFCFGARHGLFFSAI
jgi:hypothetical protein